MKIVDNIFLIYSSTVHLYSIKFGLNDNLQLVDLNKGTKKKYPEGTIKWGVCHRIVCVQAVQTKPLYQNITLGPTVEDKPFNDFL